MNLYLEIFGYCGTALVLLSMAMSSLKKLRMLNTLGSLIALTYAIAVKTYPVFFLNLGMIIINVTQLIKEERRAK